jgi:C-1 hydroxylase
MSLEENKAIVRRFIDAYNTHDVTLMEEFIAPDYVDHTRARRRHHSVWVISSQHPDIRV